MSRTSHRRPVRRRLWPGRLAACVVGLVIIAVGTLYYLRDASADTGAVSAVGLRTEYLSDPIGIDTTQPRFSWVATSSKDLASQYAYQVQVAESDPALDDGQGVLWDSGRVESFEYLDIVYGGPALSSGGRYTWRVRLWDGDGLSSDWSETASWQMGLLDETAWSGATWIAPSSSRAEEALMRRAFDPGGGELDQATLTVAAVGFHLAQINGSPVGDGQMRPSRTDYNDHIEYITYDVTGMVTSGEENVLGIALAGGWYGEQSLRCRLELRYADGTSQSIVSDGQWQWASGDVTYASIYGGEDIDHTRSIPNWSSSAGDTTAFAAVVTDATPEGEPELVAAAYPAERRIGTVAMDARKTSTGYLYTLSESSTVALMLIATGEPGTVVRLRVGDGLSDDQVDSTWHDLNDQASSDRWQEANFTLGSSDSETFTTSFTYFSGSYIDLHVVDGSLTEEPTVQAFTVHTDVTTVGSFTTSDEALTALHQAVHRTYLNNLHGYPTATSDRDRLGSALEAAALAETGLLNFDTAAIYAKWMVDLRDAQADDGSLPADAPSQDSGSSSVSPWSGGAIATVPLALYRLAHDTRVLEEHYPAMRAYADYLIARLSEWLWTAECSSADPGAVDTTDASAFNTLGVFVTIQAVAEAADLLGKTEDMYVYQEQAETIRSAFNTRWFDQNEHTYTRQPGAAFERASQSLLATALATGMVPDGEEQSVFDSLLADIAAPTVGAEYANHLLTGVVGTRYLFQVLADSGSADLAFGLLTQQDYPGVLPGALAEGGTLYERIASGSLSHNYIGFGSFDVWLFRGVCGIILDELASSDLIRIRPTPVTGVDWAEAETTTPAGVVSSRWERTSSGVKYRVVVPVGVTAEVSLVATSGSVFRGTTSIATFTDPYDSQRQVVHLRSGTYSIEIR